MKKIKLLSAFLLLFFTFISCDEQLEIQDSESIDNLVSIDKKNQVKLQPTTLSKNQILDISCGEPTTMTLYAGQHINVGEVIISNDETNLYVTYEVSGNWWLNGNGTHLYVGSEEDLPLNGGGNPKIGHFPYHGEHGLVQSYTFTIPLIEFNECFIISTHAEVVKLDGDNNTIQDETAFGCGNESKTFDGNRWGCYFDYCKKECDENCIDAFALKIQFPEYYDCFLDDGFTQWGWTSQMTHKHMKNYQTKNNSFFQIPLYVKSDNCDTTQGEKIGYVEFEAIWEIEDSGNVLLFANVRYVLNTANYTLSEVNLFIGENKYPKDINGNNSVSTNYYTYQVSLDKQTEYTFSKINWPGTKDSFINIIAHAKVCEANLESI